MNNDGLGLRVNFLAELIGEDGRVKQTVYVHNATTTQGKYGVADQILASPTLTKIGWMAVGTGSPAANALGAELDRNAFTTLTRLNAVVTAVGDWAAGDGTGTLTEAGLFDQASLGGNMWASATFSMTKGGSDVLKITWTLTIS
jgi:hypothetical protein